MINRNLELEVVSFYNKNQLLIEDLHDAIKDTEQADQHYSKLTIKQDEVRDTVRQIGFQSIANTEIARLYSSTKRAVFEHSLVVKEANRKVADKGTILSIDAVDYFRQVTDGGSVLIGDINYGLEYDVLTVNLGRLTLALASGRLLNKVANQVFNNSNNCTQGRRYAKVPELKDWKQLVDSLESTPGVLS